MDDLYRDNLIDHYKHPRHHGPLPDATISLEGQNPLCGDHVHLHLRLAPGNERIEAISFESRACTICTAAMSMLTEMVVEDPRVERAAAIERPDIEEAVGIPLSPPRLKCALLGLGTLKIALHRAAGTPLPEAWVGSDEIEWGA